MQFKDTFHLKSNISLVLLAASFLAACGDRSQQQANPQVEKNSPVTVATTPSPEKTSGLTVQINTAPLFESQQGWGAGYIKAIGHGPGVVVGPGGENPNVFAQQFTAKPDERFKVVARASSVDKPKAMGRFQINWTDAGGKYISASIKAFEVTPEEKTFEHELAAPAGTASGTLYVVADGPKDVVRYTEMRLLGSDARSATK